MSKRGAERRRQPLHRGGTSQSCSSPAQRSTATAYRAYVAYLGERPTDAGAMTNLAVSLTALGHLDEAVSAFRRAVEMNSADALARRNLAMALEDQAQAQKR
jgi:Flp pilus assembly protein TadD